MGEIAQAIVLAALACCVTFLMSKGCEHSHEMNLECIHQGNTPKADGTCYFKEK